MFAALLALCITVDVSLTDEVSIWEHNAVLCPQTMKPTLEQEIFWRLEEHDGVTDYFVAAWRMSSSVNTLPQPLRGEWVGHFHDQKDKVRRTIRAKLFLDTESIGDFELLDRQRLPEDKRSGLKQKKP